VSFLRVAALAVVAAVAAAPAATPESEQVLAYEAPDGIHLVAADGSGDRLVRGSEPGDQNPDWSPPSAG